MMKTKKKVASSKSSAGKKTQGATRAAKKAGQKASKKSVAMAPKKSAAKSSAKVIAKATTKPSKLAGLKNLLTKAAGSKKAAPAKVPAKGKTAAPAKAPTKAAKTKLTAAQKSAAKAAAKAAAATLKAAAKAATASAPKGAKGAKDTKAPPTNEAVKAAVASALGKKVPGTRSPRSRSAVDPDSVCREVACDGLNTTAGYCRMHYIKNWKKIKRKEVILKEGKLNQYIEELVAKYPDKYIEAIRQDLYSDKDFAKVIYDLDLDETVDEYDPDAETAEGLIDNVKRDFEDGDSDF